MHLYFPDQSSTPNSFKLCNPSITAMNDPSKSLPLNCRLSRLPFKNIFLLDSTVGIISRDHMDCVVISCVLIESLVLCVIVLLFQGA